MEIQIDEKAELKCVSNSNETREWDSFLKYLGIEIEFSNLFGDLKLNLISENDKAYFELDNERSVLKRV